MAQLSVSAATDTGPVRATNQDAVLADGDLAAVADGLGGHVAGDVASAIAIEALRSTFDGGSIEDLRNAVRAANAAVWQRSRADRGLEGMGTTLCAAGLVDVDDRRQLGLVNVGDSRAYVLRSGQLAQITEDHSFVAELLRQGELDAEHAADHPQRNVLTRVVGIEPDVHADSFVVMPQLGDRFLLCTDGLVNEIDDEEISSILASVAEGRAACEMLVDHALRAGGNDNVSVVVLDVTATDD